MSIFETIYIQAENKLFYVDGYSTEVTLGKEIRADCYIAVKQLNYTSVRTHKNQSFSSHRPSNGKKIMFFVIPEMPSKTFVMV